MHISEPGENTRGDTFFMGKIRRKDISAGFGIQNKLGSRWAKIAFLAYVIAGLELIEPGETSKCFRNIVNGD